MTRSLAGLLLLLLCACNRPSTTSGTKDVDSTTLKKQFKDSLIMNSSDSGAAPKLITCDGIGNIHLADSYEDVLRKVGKDQLKNDSVFLEGNFEKLFTKAYPGQHQEIRIYWKEDQPPFKSIDMLEIDMEESPYQFSNGIRIGTTLKEMQKLNADPIR